MAPDIDGSILSPSEYQNRNLKKLVYVINNPSWSYRNEMTRQKYGIK
jgi:hypothetical protein